MAQADSDIVKFEPRIGGSGLAIFGGHLYNMADYNPLLTGQSACNVWEEMRLGDPEVAAGLSRLIWPLLAAQWKIEPVDDSDEEIAIAEFCEKWIMGRGRHDPFAPRWQDTLRHALLCLSDGVSAFEKVWGIDADGNQVYAQLAGILPKSIREFVFSTDGSGRLEEIVQAAVTDRGIYETAHVPAAKLMIFTFAKEANNLWGRPILRACYKPWYHGDKLARLDGMRHERHGLGFTVMKVSAGAGDGVKTAAEALVREARAHEKQYAVIEGDQELDIKYPNGTGTDILGSMKHWNEMISQVLVSEVMHLGGTSNTGSRAVSESKFDFLLAVLQGLGTSICEVFDVQAIPELVRRNSFPRGKGVDPDALPTMKLEDLSKLSGVAMAETLSKLMPTGSGLLTPGPALEQHIRETYQLPPIEEDVFEAMKEAEKLKAEQSLEMLKNPPAAISPAAGSAPPAPGAPQPPAGKVPPQEVPPAKAASERGARKMREPFAHEAHFALRENTAFLDDEPKRIWAQVVAAKREDIVRRLANAVSKMTDAELRSNAPPRPMVAPLTNELYPFLLGAYMRGRRSILAERDRQRSGIAPDPVRMAENDPSYEADLQPTKTQESWVRFLAGSFSGALLTSMGLAAVRAASNARNADVTKSAERRAIEDAVRALSVPRQQADLSGVVTQAFTNGRNEQADTMRSEIDSAYYSAIMDQNTCDACAPFDGEQHDPGDPAYATPNPNCLGGDRCRCVTIYVFQEAAKAA